VDACVSGTLIEPTDINPFDNDDLRYLCKAIENEPVDFQEQIQTILDEQQNVALTAEIAYISASDDSTNAVDSIFKQAVSIYYRKIADGKIKLGNYAAFINQLKNLLSDIYFPTTLKFNCGSIERLIDRFPQFENIICDLGFDFKSKQQSLYDYMSKNNQYVDFVLRLKLQVERGNLAFLGIDLAKLKETLDSLDNLYKFKASGLPILRYYGTRVARSSDRLIFEPYFRTNAN
jgi:hypothetical protein